MIDKEGARGSLLGCGNVLCAAPDGSYMSIYIFQYLLHSALEISSLYALKCVCSVSIEKFISDVRIQNRGYF